MSNLREYVEVTDIVVTCPTYVKFRCHGYCSQMSKIFKYLEVRDIVVTGPRYVNI
jgi:hypothetical protein